MPRHHSEMELEEVQETSLTQSDSESSPTHGVNNPAYTADNTHTNTNSAAASSSPGEESDKDTDDDGLSQDLDRYESRSLQTDASRIGEDFDQHAAKVWDVFEETPKASLEVVDRLFWSRVYVVSRFLLFIVLFVIVLGSSVICTFSFLVIVFNFNSTAFPSTTTTLPSTTITPPSTTTTLPSTTTTSLGNGCVKIMQAGIGSGKVRVHWVWAAMLMTSAPYFFTLLSCLQRMCAKRTRALAWRPLLLALGIETLHSVGLGMLVYVVAPSYDPVVVLVLTLPVALIPGVLRLWKPQGDATHEELAFSWLDLACLLCTAGSLVALLYQLHVHAHNNLYLTLLAPLALLLLSSHSWENFIPVKQLWKKLRKIEHREKRKFKKTQLTGQWEGFKQGSILFRAKYAIRDRRTKIEALAALWKIVLNVIIPIAVFASKGTGTACISVLFFFKHSADSCSVWGNGLDASPESCSSYLPFMVAVAAVLASGVGYKMAKVACKIHAQPACFALPLLLCVPVTAVLVVGTYSNGLSLVGCTTVLWPDMKGQTWYCLLRDYARCFWLPVSLLSWLGLSWTTRHVWRPSAERVASTDKLFTKPLYCGVLFWQSLMLNRAMDDDVSRQDLKTSSGGSDPEWLARLKRTTAQLENVDDELNHKNFPRIYACATMWHETAKEMTQLLKSLFRMDNDQFIRACMWKRFNVIDKDFYIYEAHIFFDDAFVKRSRRDGGEFFVVNTFVKQLMEVVDEAARCVYPAGVAILPPTKMDSPYGGRLTYTLPGCNQLVVHLKNSFRIRHKKRWSQVMYMYYLLSYKLLLETPGGGQRLADNTFLLALDGDVDFYPEAVQRLLDRMRRNMQVGAACGRIHPVGSGPMVWYQRFEYSVSHWLQKATEHVLGCVLCSPGCFSLFRGSALIEDNVLKKYTTQATQAKHALQYDMGEDRWLCTLLLQQGKRVEYAASSDAFTFCPDDLGEFYKQRRRWTPSTMANLLDLLGDWRHVTQANNSISLPFMAYQLFLFVSSVLTPGTIFLLILGAINTAYPTLPLYSAMLLNLVPIILFIALNFCASHRVQMAYTMVLSVAYSLVMMVVLVGLLRQVSQSGMCSITAIFFVGVVGIFCLAALLHPQELWNILFGLLYFLAIPSTSMLLIFYAVANINVVTWGTRDTNKATNGDAPAVTGLQRLHGGLKRMVSMSGLVATNGYQSQTDQVSSDYTFSFGNLFRCICCPSKKENDLIMERLEGIEEAMYSLRTAIKAQHSPNKHDDDDEYHTSETEMEKPEQNTESFNWETGSPLPFQDKKKVTMNPLFGLEGGEGEEREEEMEALFWYEDAQLGTGERKSMDQAEQVFWDELIEKYLWPLHRDPDHAEKTARMGVELTRLRNKVAAFFFLANALFVTVIFILESVAEYTPGLSIRLPCDEGHAGQKIEPISGAFTFIFGILLVLQCFGMMLHRFSTLVHIVAAASLRSKKHANADSADNYRRFGTSPFFDLTSQLLQEAGNIGLTGSVRSDSDNTSYVLGRSVSQESLSVGKDDIMKRLLKRQKTANKKEQKGNLYQLVDARLESMIDCVEQSSSRQQTPRVTDTQQLPPGQSGDGGEASSSAVDLEARPNDDQSPPDPSAAPAKLSWMETRSLETFMSFANNPKNRELMRKRTAKQKWDFAVQKINVHSSGRPSTSNGQDGGRSTPGMAIVVENAMANAQIANDTRRQPMSQQPSVRVEFEDASRLGESSSSLSSSRDKGNWQKAKKRIVRTDSTDMTTPL